MGAVGVDGVKEDPPPQQKSGMKGGDEPPGVEAKVTGVPLSAIRERVAAPTGHAGASGSELVAISSL
jgi:hypothetical protein